MRVINSYNDIINEIDIHKIIIENAENEKKQLLKLLHSNKPRELRGMCYSGMPNAPYRNAMSMDRIVEAIERCENLIFIEESIMQGLEVTKQDIENKIGCMDGLEYKVFKCRQVDKLTVKETAEKLNYSERHIKRISKHLVDE